MSEPTDAADRTADDRDELLERWRDATLQRLSFQLTYARDTTRRFHAMGIVGADLPNSYQEGEMASGSWDQDGMADPTDERALVAEAFNAALGEAVHEALEWFKLDGQPLLDPHDRGVEDDVHAAVRDLTDALLFLAEGRTLRLSDEEFETSEPVLDYKVTRFYPTGTVGAVTIAAIAEDLGLDAALQQGRAYVRHPKGDAAAPLFAALREAGWCGDHRDAAPYEVDVWNDSRGETAA